MPSAKLKLNVNSIISGSSESNAKKRAWKKVFIENPSAVVEFGLRVIDKIIERTLGGSDVNDRAFKPYSRVYKKSDVFKIYGKDSTVDLKLTGSMLADLSATKVSDSSVLLHFPTEEENLKASRHNFGLAGMPERKFMGISNDDSMIILKSVVSDYNDGIGDLLSQTNDTQVSVEDNGSTVSAGDVGSVDGEING